MRHKGEDTASEPPNRENAAIQVICLGAGGGPSEDSVTGFLVRSTAAKWAKNSILAVDAGSHLSAIQRILEKDFPLVAADCVAVPPISAKDGTGPAGESPSSDTESIMTCSSDPDAAQPLLRRISVLEAGPFAGLAFPHSSARANAVHIVREHVSTYLITHPHLDHFAGFAMNTAAFHNTSRPKRLAALPFTVNAIKTHIFNDIIWPNLTDEEGGVGLVTFQRLTEGGNLALGEGGSRGFIEVCDGLAVKGFKVSHGRCAGAPRAEPPRRGSGTAMVALDNIAPLQHNHTDLSQGGMHLPQPSGGSKTSRPDARRTSVYSQPSQPGTPNPLSHDQTSCVVDSSAFFVRADDTGREILVFGDVEPDSLSAFPRNHLVWTEAASRISHGNLTGIFIECSYNDTQRDAVLFGHLAPRHLIKELELLAELVANKRRDSAEKIGRKRKRHSTVMQHVSEAIDTTTNSTSTSQDEAPRPPKPRTTDTLTPKRVTMQEEPTEIISNRIAGGSQNVPGKEPVPLVPHSDGRLMSTIPEPPYSGPLKGVQIIVIHVKDTMTDGPLVGETILQDLWAHEARLASQGKGLGCSFEIAASGGSYWF